MKAMIGRLFARREAGSGAANSSQLTNSDIESYYLKVIAECLRRMLVPAESIEIDVRRSGTGPTGLTAFAGYVRIVRWDPVLTPVLLQNMPVIDARIRKVAAASVILEHTHFAGIWFQATSSTVGAPKTLLGVPAEIVVTSGC
ncbi:hypothetical protein [Ramlibacter albus]|uniref:Uncharacterized protein n=1 Tax=Ramlibacter albus TaxID=2079448 RepID=A0A923M5H1_9BURK|nr:hypothetical protein [Ramlibacter albus]MBC5763121.1 hypothetical protein [Ramlibacter albus]